MTELQKHQRCFIKNLFLKISPYSQENTFVGVKNYDLGKTLLFQNETGKKHVFYTNYLIGLKKTVKSDQILGLMTDF